MSWPRRPIKYVAKIAVSNVDKKSHPNEFAVRLVNYTDVYYEDEITPELSLMQATATRAQIETFGLRPGDVLITKDSETADDIAVSSFVDIAEPDMVLGYHLALLRPKQTVDPKFLYWAVSSEWARSQFSVGATGVTRFGLRLEAIGSITLSFPSVTKQRQVADFLDRETARIDALITKKQRLSELSQQRWLGQLLDKLGVSRPCRDGTTDIRVLPAGWQVGTLKRLLSDSFGGDWGSEPGADNTDLPCVRSADFDFVGLQALKGAVRSFDKQTASSRRVFPGDLVIEKSGGGEGVPVGRVVAWRGNGPAVPTNFAGGLIPAHDADRQYVLLAFRAAYELGLPWRSIKQTTGLQNLDLNHYLNHVWPLPPLVEQQVIATELVRSLERVLTLNDRLSRQIALLREHRQALITAAVTGELEIT